MLMHYLKIAIRSVLRDKGYSVVNILGLSIAIACCFLLIFWVKFEMSYENCFVNADRIYRLIEVEKRKDGLSHTTNIYPEISKELKNTFPQIEAATVAFSTSTALGEVGNPGDGIIVNFMEINNLEFLAMFDFEYIEGSPQAVVSTKGCILSEEAAHKFFGNSSAIGKTLSNGLDEYFKYTIQAVVRLPENTQIRFDLLHVSDKIDYGMHYIMLKKGTQMTPDFRNQLAHFLATNRETKNTLKLQSLKDVHLHTPNDILTKEERMKYGNLSQIYFFSFATLLILCVAIINYVNTSISRAMSRIKEVGVRKVTGATKQQLIERFLFEAFLVSLVAVLLGLFLVEFLFSSFTQLMGNRLVFDFDGQSFFIALFFCAIITLLSGGYAAFYLSSFSPILIFRGGNESGSKNGLRKLLIGIQFFLSVGVLICTYIIYRQIDTLFTTETGVNRENIIVLESGLWYKAEDFIKIIKQENPNIVDASIASCAPYNTQYSYSGIYWAGCKEEVKNMEFSQISCDSHYANTFGLKIIEGEFIPPNLPWWQDSEPKSFNILINESFKKLMGIENPIGVTITYNEGYKGKIIGVVKDFNFKPLKDKITPLIISFNPEVCDELFIKTTGKDQQQTLNYILSKYKEMKVKWERRPVLYHTVKDEYNQIYETELRSAGILSVFSIISFILSLMGIISMVSFMIEKRTKEIAIRKINGAERWDIIKLFCTDILRVTALASIIAIPICYLLMAKWLEDYIYRTRLSWWIFILIPLWLVSIIFLVIASQVYFTTRQNPVESLRSE